MSDESTQIKTKPAVPVFFNCITFAVHVLGSILLVWMLRCWFIHLLQVTLVIASLLYGIAQCDLLKLQRVQNIVPSAARLVCCESEYSHITPVLQNLHWLPVKA